MILYSFSFLIYFSIVLLLMVILQFCRKQHIVAKTIQLLLILAFSYFLIFICDWRFFACVALVTILSYAFGIWIENRRNKFSLIFGIVTLCAILGYFKYTNFFVNSFRTIFGMDTITLKMILPIGISFYIFSSISYLIDVYREDYKAEKNILYFAVFIALFSKFTAGPIVRGKDFFPQVKEYRGIEWDSFKVGIQIFTFGLFKKIVLADHLGVFVDDIFWAPTAYNTGTILLGVISYSLQIYLDFSGYSDMAIGVSKIIGFDFLPNFNLPYISQNISEFWKRWHISLSSWFQDYLYIPLGGNRKGKFRTYINMFLVMVISGLWHGAGWTFIVWGALHGIANCINKLVGKKLKQLGPCINGILTFMFVSFLWIIFRAENISNAINVLYGLER